MKEIVPLDSRYVPLTQQPWCCVPACISIIMLKRGLPLIPQELLGYYLGLTVPLCDRRKFWNARASSMRGRAGGTKMYLSRFNPNLVFPKIGVRLRMIHYKIASFDSDGNAKLFEFLDSIDKKDRDVIVAFEHRTLFPHGMRGGHVNVVDRAFVKNGTIRLIEPHPFRPKWRTIKINRLLKEIRRR